HLACSSHHDMTRTQKIMTLLLLLGVVAPAGAKCVFKKSCTRKAFKCFQPKGACTGALADEGSSAVCWPNGSKISAGATGITVLGRKGKPCLTGTVLLEPTGESEVSFVRHGKTWVLRNNTDGTRSFVCPNGKVETYTADDFRSGIACGHIPVFGAGSSCAPGTCQ